VDVWIGLLKDLGFPIVVTLYLLMRIEAKLEQLATSIVQLDQTLLQWLEKR
jgi:hypothetical protein